MSKTKFKEGDLCIIEDIGKGDARACHGKKSFVGGKVIIHSVGPSPHGQGYLQAETSAAQDIYYYPNKTKRRRLYCRKGEFLCWAQVKFKKV